MSKLGRPSPGSTTDEAKRVAEALVRGGKYADGEARLRSMLQSAPDLGDDPSIINLLGICCLSQGRGPEAEDMFRRVLVLEPAAAPAFANLGMALRLQNRGDDALVAFRRAVELDSSEPRNFLQLFKQLQQLSRWAEAVAVVEAGVRKHPGASALREALAVTYGRVGRREEAETLFDDLSGGSSSSANHYANWLQEEGRFADSVRVLTRSLELTPLQGEAYRLLVEARQRSVGGKDIRETALALVEDPRLDDSARMHLFYALGKLQDAAGDSEAAIRTLDAANSIAYRTYPASQSFDQDRTRREPELIKGLFTKEFFERYADIGSQDARPIFIVGMVRSGTTLVDQMLTAHPNIDAVGEGAFWTAESDALHPCWRGEGPSAPEVERLAARYLSAVGIGAESGRFTDKMPLNFRNLGPIHVTFPSARILHVRRDPFDTCLSIYGTFFGGGPNFAYDAENIATFYRAYLDYMSHWRCVLSPDRFLEIDYETLVADPEPVVRQILGFLGLPWDAACLSPEANRHPVTTPSRWQARQPIYATSIGKRARLGPFVPVFASLPGTPSSEFKPTGVQLR